MSVHEQVQVAGDAGDLEGTAGLGRCGDFDSYGDGLLKCGHSGRATKGVWEKSAMGEGVEGCGWHMACFWPQAIAPMYFLAGRQYRRRGWRIFVGGAEMPMTSDYPVMCGQLSTSPRNRTGETGMGFCRGMHRVLDIAEAKGVRRWACVAMSVRIGEVF